MNILFLMSGSIACAKSTGLISSVIKKGHQVKVVATASTFEFVGKATLEGLTGNPVISSVFEEGEMMEHIHLSRWADKIILAPATANTINKIVAGIADEMVTTTWIAAQQLNKPMYLAPAMNGIMWNFPTTQQSIEKLKQWNIKVLMPSSGELACGENDMGRMMEVVEIESELLKTEIRKLDKKVLITAGGTREFIDGVRYIGNLSSGRTGAQIADYFSLQGYQVTWLGAKDAIVPKLECEKYHYQSFDDLASYLEKLLSENDFEVVIHAAAVSDYSVTSVLIDNEEIEVNQSIKLPTADTMQLKLTKNPKLVSRLSTWSNNKDIKICAFKLTNTADMEKRLKAVEKLISQSQIDYVAHNDLSEISSDTHSFNLYHSKNDFTTCASTQELCENIQVALEKSI